MLAPALLPAQVVRPLAGHHAPVSAVVFLYSPKTTLASVAIVNLDEAGDIGPASAMASLVVATSAVVCVLYYFIQAWLDRRTQAWRSS